MRTPLTEGVPAGSSGPVRPEGAVGEGQQKLQKASTVSHMKSERKSRKCGSQGKKAGAIGCAFGQEVNYIQRI